jgi:tRNA nucleotidyltransferase/poly(A) polymerase
MTTKTLNPDETKRLTSKTTASKSEAKNVTQNKNRNPTETKTSKSIPIKPAPTLPTEVRDACKKLSAQGHKAWLAGGCVRDMLMNRQARDWDIVTDAPVEQIRTLFPKHLEVGASFGVIKLPPSERAAKSAAPVQIDIAIFRKESGYSDRRHPDVVEVGDEQSDVARRDFTVNAMYYDPTTSTIFDFVGGHRDIQAKVLCTVGNPVTRFEEDALRILRAVRFTAQLGFKIDRDTSNALKKCAPLLHEISRERVREETFRLLTSPRPVVGLEALAQNGLWEMVFGIRRVSIPADLRQLKLSWTPTALHWLAGLVVTGMLGDPLKEPDEMIERLTERLRLSNAERRVLARVAYVYTDAVADKPKTAPMDWVELGREDKPLLDIVKSFIRRARGPSELEKDKAIALIEQAVRWVIKPGAEKVWPTADSLMKDGVKAGPKLGAELKIRQWKAFWIKPT